MSMIVQWLIDKEHFTLSVCYCSCIFFVFLLARYLFISYDVYHILPGQLLDLVDLIKPVFAHSFVSTLIHKKFFQFQLNLVYR